MPRRDEDDRPRKRKSNAPLVLGLVGAGVLAILMGAVAMGVVGWLEKDRARSEPGADPNLIPAAGGKEGDANRTYTRDQFREAVMGKTPDQVIAAVGRPLSTSEDPRGRSQTWYYFGKVLNPATGKLDSGIVKFRDGTVVEVRW